MALDKCISRSKFSIGAQNGSQKCISRSKFSIGAQNGFQKMYLPFEVFYWSSEWLSKNVPLVRSFLLEFFLQAATTRTAINERDIPVPIPAAQKTR